MYNSSNKSDFFNQDKSELDLTSLIALLREQAQRRPLFENVAIIGCGYVGTALANYWQQQGHFITATTTTKNRLGTLQELAAEVVVMRGDNLKAMQSLVQHQDTIVVSVAPTANHTVNASIYEETYLTTAENLARALSQSSSSKQVIYLSSYSVYGHQNGDWADENFSIVPTTPKAQILSEAEQILLQSAQEKHKVCILRLGGIYGPGRELVQMFGSLAGQTLPGKGDRYLNWIHLDDIVWAIEFARWNQLQGIYNLVDDSKLTIRELVEQVCLRYGLPKVAWDSSKPSWQNNSVRVSNQKLQETGFQLIHSQLVI
jgi:nucleoside-diphosphate-sugar epimerase